MKMKCREPIAEFRAVWLPNMTDAGLTRLTNLLATASPMLIHGAFTRAMPMGCLATHIAWNHPKTAHLTEEAGICWLTKVARLNPATSKVVVQWDRGGLHDRELRFALLQACRTEQAMRADDTFHDVAEYCAVAAD